RTTPPDISDPRRTRKGRRAGMGCSLMDVNEIVFQVEHCEESGYLVTSSDDSASKGGITTQGKDLRELQKQVADAVRCHFEPKGIPRKIRFHFEADPVLVDL